MAGIDWWLVGIDKSSAGGTYAFVTACFGSLRKASGLEQPGDPYNLAAYDVADHCFINTLTHVSSFTATAMPSRAGFQDYNGKFGWYDEVLDGCGMSNRQRWTQDLTVVDENTLGGGLSDTGAAPQDNASLSRLGRVQVYLGILQTNGQDGDALETMQEEIPQNQALRCLASRRPNRRAVLRAAGLWDEDPI
ncbi:hypothetical protein ARSEF1564_000740 [Beauveria bassiana]